MMYDDGLGQAMEMSALRDKQKEMQKQYVNMGALTLRDYFAANAPEASLGFERKWISQTELEPIEKSIARWNYAYADAMLAEREAK